MNNNFEKFKNFLQGMHMSADEKRVMKNRLVLFIQNYSTEPKTIKSPYVHHNFILRPLQAVAFALVLVLSGGSGLAFASQKSLPGDALYNFKVDVAEEIVAFVQYGPKAKAQNAIDRTARRLDETAELALQGKLDDNAKESISKHIQEHADDVRRYTQNVKDEQLQTELALASRFESAVTPRTQILKEIKEEKQINGELGTILAVTEKNVDRVSESKKIAEQELTEANDITDKERAETKISELTKQIDAFIRLVQEKGGSSTNEIDTKEGVSVLVSEIEDSPNTTAPTSTEAEAPQKIESEQALIDGGTRTSGTTSTTALIDSAKVVISETETKSATSAFSPTQEQANIEMLIEQAREKIEEEKYSEALILLQNAQTQVDSATTLLNLKELIKNVESQTKEVSSSATLRQ